MSDIWYLAEGESSVGPLSLADLASKIAAAKSPTDAMVWRPGFTDWQKAGSVQEIADSVFKPPPLRTTQKPVEDPPTIPKTIDRSEDLTGVKWSPGDKSALKGIGGWLVLVAIGQVLGPLKSFATLVQYFSTIERGLFERFPVTFIGEALLNGFVFTFVVATAVAFFKHSRRFPQMFLWAVIIGVLSFPVDALWVAATLSIASGQPMNAFWGEISKGPELAQSIGLAIGGGLWCLYVFNSKRVANTFVN